MYIYLYIYIHIYTYIHIYYIYIYIYTYYRRYLPNPRYFEYAKSQDGDWEQRHMGEELYAMLAESWPAVRKRRGGGRRDNRLPELTRVAGGARSYAEARNGEWLPWCGVAGDALEDEESAPTATTNKAREAAKQTHEAKRGHKPETIQITKRTI